jgi:hypothetical protein
LYLLALFLGFLSNTRISLLGIVGHNFGELLSFGIDRRRSARIGEFARSARQTYLNLAESGMSPDQIQDPFRTELSILLRELPEADHDDFRYALERELKFIQNVIAVSRTRNRETPM